MRTSKQRRSDQSKIWENISEKSPSFRVASETSAMSTIYEQQGGQLEDYVSSFSALEGQSGAVFAIDGNIVGLELFDSAETLQKLLPKILPSYGLDALDHARSKHSKKKTLCTPEQASEFIKKVTEAKAEEFPAVGEGMDIRLSNPNLRGAALAAEDHVLHLSAFMIGN
jgi:hypothetical protein